MVLARRIAIVPAAVALGATTLLLSSCTSGPATSGTSTSGTSTSVPATSVPTTPTTATPPAAGTAAAILATATSDARKTAGVHIDIQVTLGSGPAANQETATGEVGQDWGSVTETLEVTGTQAVATIELINGTAYVRGTSAGLRAQPLGIVSAGVAQDYAGTWIAVPSTSPSAQSLQSGLTIASVVTETSLSQARFAPGSSGSGSTTTVLGKGSSALGVGAISCSENLTGVNSGKPLPASIVCTDSNAWIDATFDDWGSGTAPSVPAGSTTIAAVLKAQG